MCQFKGDGIDPNPVYEELDGRNPEQTGWFTLIVPADRIQDPEVITHPLVQYLRDAKEMSLFATAFQRAAYIIIDCGLLVTVTRTEDTPDVVTARWHQDPDCGSKQAYRCIHPLSLPIDLGRLKTRSGNSEPDPGEVWLAAAKFCCGKQAW